jgi:hypothetical protein
MVGGFLDNLSDFALVALIVALSALFYVLARAIGRGAELGIARWRGGRDTRATTRPPGALRSVRPADRSRLGALGRAEAPRALPPPPEVHELRGTKLGVEHRGPVNPWLAHPDHATSSLTDDLQGGLPVTRVR